jgi:hypothetical protein
MASPYTASGQHPYIVITRPYVVNILIEYRAHPYIVFLTTTSVQSHFASP